MRYIDKVKSFGFIDLDGKQQSIIKEFVQHIAFYDYNLKDNIKECIFQIEILESNFIVYLNDVPNDNQLEVMNEILIYLFSKHQFHGKYIFLGLTNIKTQNDN